LIVDDDFAFASAISEALAHDGYDCTLAANATDARALAEAQRARGEPFALALVDVRLPDASGVELAQELGLRARMPCLLMTGWDLESLKEDRKSAAEVLVKPFSVERLLRALSAARSAQS
jgi:DNA-binding response OmpR family regulator